MEVEPSTSFNTSVGSVEDNESERSQAESERWTCDPTSAPNLPPITDEVFTIENFPYNEAEDHLNKAMTPLPIFSHQKSLLESIEKHHVTVLSGETGCGKSSGLPLMMLNYVRQTRQEFRCFIAQPRRVAAIRLAERVAAELGEGTMGKSVGVRISREVHDTTCPIVFATTGYLLQWFAHNPQALDNVTHLILDEVHERTVDQDLLCLLAKMHLERKIRDEKSGHGKSFKLVVMSATLNAVGYQNYFTLPDDPTPFCGVPLFVGAKRYPVKEIYSDSLQELHNSISKSTEFMKFQNQTDNFTNMAFRIHEDLQRRFYSDGVSSPDINEIEQDDRKLREVHRTGAFEFKLKRLSAIQTSEVVHGATVVMNYINGAFESKLGDPGAVLVFLPGEAELLDMMDAIRNRSFTCYQTGGKISHNMFNVKLYVLHSSVEREEVDGAFVIPEAGTHKIVLSTNIAESSVTIPDVALVMDFGRRRAIEYDDQTQTMGLALGWNSRASAVQRLGRAGRVGPGTCIRMYPRTWFTRALNPYDDTEISQVPLSQTILQSKGLFPELETAPLLGRLLDPPDTTRVEASLKRLYRFGAITDPAGRWFLTYFGEILPKLGTADIREARLLILGAAMGIPVQACIMAAGTTDLFTQPNSSYHDQYDRSEYQKAALKSFTSRFRFDFAHSEVLAQYSFLMFWCLNDDADRQLSANSVSLQRFRQYRGRVAQLAHNLADLLDEASLNTHDKMYWENSVVSSANRGKGTKTCHSKNILQLRALVKLMGFRHFELRGKQRYANNKLQDLTKQELTEQAFRGSNTALELLPKAHVMERIYILLLKALACNHEERIHFAVASQDKGAMSTYHQNVSHQVREKVSQQQKIVTKWPERFSVLDSSVSYFLFRSLQTLFQRAFEQEGQCPDYDTVIVHLRDLMEQPGGGDPESMVRDITGLDLADLLRVHWGLTPAHSGPSGSRFISRGPDEDYVRQKMRQLERVRDRGRGSSLAAANVVPLCPDFHRLGYCSGAERCTKEHSPVLMSRPMSDTDRENLNDLSAPDLNPAEEYRGLSEKPWILVLPEIQGYSMFIFADALDTVGSNQKRRGGKASIQPVTILPAMSEWSFKPRLWKRGGARFGGDESAWEFSHPKDMKNVVNSVIERVIESLKQLATSYPKTRVLKGFFTYDRLLTYMCQIISCQKAFFSLREVEKCWDTVDVAERVKFLIKERDHVRELLLFQFGYLYKHRNENWGKGNTNIPSLEDLKAMHFSWDGMDAGGADITHVFNAATTVELLKSLTEATELYLIDNKYIPPESKKKEIEDYQTVMKRVATDFATSRNPAAKWTAFIHDVISDALYLFRKKDYYLANPFCLAFVCKAHGRNLTSFICDGLQFFTIEATTGIDRVRVMLATGLCRDETLRNGRQKFHQICANSGGSPEEMSTKQEVPSTSPSERSVLINLRGTKEKTWDSAIRNGFKEYSRVAKTYSQIDHKEIRLVGTSSFDRMREFYLFLNGCLPVGEIAASVRRHEDGLAGEFGFYNERLISTKMMRFIRNWVQDKSKKDISIDFRRALTVDLTFNDPLNVKPASFSPTTQIFFADMWNLQRALEPFVPTRITIVTRLKNEGRKNNAGADKQVSAVSIYIELPEDGRDQVFPEPYSMGMVAEIDTPGERVFRCNVRCEVVSFGVQAFLNAIGSGTAANSRIAFKTELPESLRTEERLAMMDASLAKDFCSTSNGSKSGFELGKINCFYKTKVEFNPKFGKPKVNWRGTIPAFFPTLAEGETMKFWYASLGNLIVERAHQEDVRKKQDPNQRGNLVNRLSATTVIPANTMTGLVALISAPINSIEIKVLDDKEVVAMRCALHYNVWQYVSTPIPLKEFIRIVNEGRTLIARLLIHGDGLVDTAEWSKYLKLLASFRPFGQGSTGIPKSASGEELDISFVREDNEMPFPDPGVKVRPSRGKIAPALRECLLDAEVNFVSRITERPSHNWGESTSRRTPLDHLFESAMTLPFFKKMLEQDIRMPPNKIWSLWTSINLKPVWVDKPLYVRLFETERTTPQDCGRGGPNKQKAVVKKKNTRKGPNKAKGKKSYGANK